MPPNFSIVPSNRGSNIINTNAALIYHHAPLRLSVSKSLEIPSISANTANPLQNPEKAARLFAKNEAEAKARFEYLQKLIALHSAE